MLARRERGFAVLEVIVAIAIFMVLAGIAVPRLYSFYRETALEYETEVLLTTLRRAQSISRTVGDVPVAYGLRSNMLQLGMVRLNDTSYTLVAGKTTRFNIEQHELLPLVRVRKHNTTGEVMIMFNDNGGLKDTSPMTIDIYCTGDASGRQIVIDQAGRIRLERGSL